MFSSWPSAVRLSVALCVCAVLLAGAAARGAAQPAAKSVAAAKALAAALDAAKLDAIAAADPAIPDTFVAALYMQGAQILVVSAKYSLEYVCRSCGRLQVTPRAMPRGRIVTLCSGSP